MPFRRHAPGPGRRPAALLAALIALATASLIVPPATATAGGLQVDPVLLELTAPAAAGTLTLRNDEDFDVDVQTRIYRWVQVDGAEHLEPTTGVAASPPIVTLAPGQDYTVRVVRTAKTPVRREESYRLWVDQLPDGRRQSASGINMLIRQSIPVFFRDRRVTRANLDWSLRLNAGRLLITGSNTGDERLRVASLRLRDTSGRTAGFGNGLVGYVLGQSSMTFTVTNPPLNFGTGGPVTIAAESNAGAVHATALVQTGP
jgi:fimbrial chaperone protein